MGIITNHRLGKACAIKLENLFSKIFLEIHSVSVLAL